MNDLIKQYNNIWKDYIEWQQKFFKGSWDIPLIYIENELKNHTWKCILDLGCWDWHDIVYFENKYKNNYFWLDASNFMINQAKENVKNKDNLFIWNFEELPFKDNIFDIVYAKYTFWYVIDFELVYKEVFRVLKKWWIFISIYNHPINDFTRKKERYPIKEILKTKLFSTNSEITYYSHTIWEIISKTFLNNFEILDITEDYMFKVLYPIPVFIWIKSKTK